MSEARKKPVSGSAGGDSEQIHRHPDISEKERLERRLTDLLLQNPETPDSEELDALLDRLDEADPLPRSEVFDTEKSLARFHEKYAALFDAVEAEAAANVPAAPEKRHFRFFKLFPVAAVLVLLVGAASAQAFSLDIFSAIARWTAEIFRMQAEEVPYAVITANPLSEGGSISCDSLEAAAETFGITAPLAPRWVPERFSLTGVAAENMPGGVLIYADYKSGDGFLQIRFEEADTVDFSSLEKENTSVTAFLCAGITHYIIFDMGYQKAIWQNGELECRISGNVSDDELRDMIDSIYKERD